MKVLVFIDDCGHMQAFDMSTEEQEYKILEGLCKEAAKLGVSPEVKNRLKQLLADKNFEGIYSLLDQKDIMHFYQRGGPTVLTAEKEWRTGLGALNL